MSDKCTTPALVIAAHFYVDVLGHYTLNSFHTWQASKSTQGWGGFLQEYWVDWCRRDRCYLFHLAGGGGCPPVVIDGLYWTPDPSWVTEQPSTLVNDDARCRNSTRRLDAMPIDLKGCDDLLDYLNQHERNEEAVWCSRCRDDLPNDDLCEHIWWCDRASWYSTPEERSRWCRCWGCTNGRGYLKEQQQRRHAGRVTVR